MERIVDAWLLARLDPYRCDRPDYEDDDEDRLRAEARWDEDRDRTAMEQAAAREEDP